MKKILSFLLTAVILTLSIISLTAAASAANTDNILTVTDEGRTLAQVEVGNEFIFRVGVNAGEYPIYNGQGHITYDSDYVEPVPYGNTNSRGQVDMDSYCFPRKIYNSSLYGVYDTKNRINYNFTKATAIDVFNDINKHYFKIRFKAIAPGTVEISHTMEALTSITDNGKYIYLYTRSRPNEQLDPIPYTQSSAEPAAALIGDADGDYDVTLVDATFIQRYMAGISSTFSQENADVNSDGDVNLRDALAIRRYKAGLDDGYNIGEWIFDSEREAE